MNTKRTDLGSTGVQPQSSMTQEHQILSIHSSSSPVPLQRNLPCLDILVASREDFLNFCVPLYEASITADWRAAKAILYKRPELVRFAISESYETPLHVAVSTKSTPQMIDFVERLVNIMEKTDLTLKDKNLNTVLCTAAAAGNIEVAKIIVSKNNALLDIPGMHGMMPLYVAAKSSRHDMVRYLYDNSRKMTADCWTHENRGWVLVKCIETDMFDVALKIVMDIGGFSDRAGLPNKSTYHSLLNALARKPNAFKKRKQRIIWRIVNSILSVRNLNVGPVEKDNDALILLRIIWGDIMRMPKTDIDDILRGPASTIYADKRHSSRVLFVATEMGNTEFVVELLKVYRDLILKLNDKGVTIIHIAVKHRHESIYNLIHEIGPMKDMILPLKDKRGNNMLHLVGKTSRKNQIEKAGKPMIMLQEYLWYREVQRMVPPVCRERRNENGEKPNRLFSNANENAWYESLYWVDYGMVVATLVLGISFAATFTVPGGFNQNNGIPIFVSQTTFSIFIIANIISLFASSVSVIAFLSIVVFGRGLREQILESLPTSMMMGLTALLVSIMAMMVTFTACIFILYHDRLKWTLVSIAACGYLILIMFASTQYPLLVDMFGSLYATRYLFKPKKSMLYDKKLV